MSFKNAPGKKFSLSWCFVLKGRMRKSLILLGICLLLALIYGLTLARGLTWANHGVDGGDLITAAATGGIAHPSGYPLYLLLAGLFQRLPFGSIAFRTNLMSAVCAIVAVAILFLLLEKQLDSTIAALIGALAFGLSPLVWSQAVIAEVYALHALLITGILYMLVIPSHRPLLYFGQGTLFGLALGNHLTTLLLAPLLMFIQPPNFQGKETIPVTFHERANAIGLRFLGILIGLLVYIALPLRARAWPPVNWGNPVTLHNFLWLVSAQMYRTSAFSLSMLENIQRFQGWAGLLLHQFTFFGLILGLYGLFSRMSLGIRLSTIWIFISFSLFAIFYAYPDSYVYLIPASISLSIWIGIGVNDLASVVANKSVWLNRTFLAVFLISILARSFFLLPQIDASRDQSAETFGQQVLSTAPKGALVFTDTDEETFTLWYFHFALRHRQDLSVIAEGLLQYAWYRQTLQETYPELEIPGNSGLISAGDIVLLNPAWPVCFFDHQEPDRLVCEYE